MQFNEVIGQQELKQQLVDMVAQNRLGHALLFLGKEGYGALPLAFALAQYLVCEKTSNQPETAGPSLFDASPLLSPEDAGPRQDSCGVCPACTKSRQFIHPDIHFSYPVIPRKSGDKPKSADYITEWREFTRLFPYGNAFDWLQFIGAENKQGNITAEECSDITRQLNLKSFESGYKILIMWMPEYLGKEGNKLLKLIEEPPANTLFIFVAENEEQILPTILSRCQLIKIPMPGQAEIAEALVSRANVSGEVAVQTAGIAQGNYREALLLLQHAEEDWQSLLREWLNATVKGGPVAQVKWIEEMSKLGREKQKQFLRFFNHLLEQSIRMRILGPENGLNNPVEADFAHRINKISGIGQQRVIIEELDRATYYIERNANPKMLFHALTIKLYHIIHDKTLILTE